MKTMAIRLEDDLHAQLALLAQLDGLPVADEVRQAIESHIARKRSEEDFEQRATEFLAQIERESVARRDAIQSLFGDKGEAPTPTERPSRRRNGPGKEA
ncbi:MAG: DNA-binding protein [Actinomycetota bacterium]|nr:DNA-binding protein [Actinomycetota bacterium]